MARLAIILTALAAIGVARVELGRRADRTRHQVHKDLTRQVMLRRHLWDQRVRIGKMLAPNEVRRRTVEMALDLTGEDESRSRVADSGDGTGRRRDE